MSNFLAVATVTATLRHLLQGAVGADVPGATVTSLRPDANANGTPAPAVNVYLYQVTPNAAWRNEDLPSRNGGGQLVQRPRAALDLHYLLTFSGNEGRLEPQRLLGSAVRALHARPLLTGQMIQDALSNPAFNFLAGSNLAEEVERVKFTPMPMSLEELSKLWSVFFQTPYLLSVAYQGTVVLIEADETPRSALPVLERNLYVLPLRQPVIEAVRSEAGENALITQGETLQLSGRNLRGEITRVRLGELEANPATLSETQIAVPLSAPPFSPNALRAGVQGVQVVHQRQLGTPPLPHRGVESNVAAFVLRPRITSVTAGATQITVGVEPTVGRKQRVALLLHETTGASPRSHVFEDAQRAADTNLLSIPVQDVAPGEYFVRLQVDGAQSPLDLEPGSPTFGPTVTTS